MIWKLVTLAIFIFVAADFGLAVLLLHRTGRTFWHTLDCQQRQDIFIP